MKQVGDQVELMVIPVPEGTVIYSYVWDFWDATSTATDIPRVTKVINIGGEPGTDELHYRCIPVARDGRSIHISGTLPDVNNPPTILPGVSVSKNDEYFAYQTRLKLQAIDLDGDPLTFGWYEGDTYLGAGNTSVIGSANGTWTGNGKVLVSPCTVSENYFDFSVLGDTSVTCQVSDDRGGMSSVDFVLRGQNEPPPNARVTSGVGGVSFDASSLASARIGVGETVDFTVYAAALTSGTLNFKWTFAGSNGWTMPPLESNGTTTLLSTGIYQNTVVRDISSEVVSTGTSKAATADLRITATSPISGESSYTDTQCTVLLIANSAPSAVSIARRVNGNPVSGLGPVNAGAVIVFSAAGTDPNMDLMFYKWTFDQPFDPNPLYLWGPKVAYNTTGYVAAQSVTGQLDVIDRLGATLTSVLPVTVIS